jgi:glycosyltransferase involved in cell wall biosynthesis
MRIGIDGSCLSNRRGFGRFARQMLGALAESDSPHEFVVFVDQPSASRVEVPERCQPVIVPVREAPSRAAAATGRRRLGDMLAMARAVARAKLDLIYFPASYSFFPVWNVPRVVVTMHDALALARPELVFPTRRGRWAWAAKEYAAAFWADRIVTVSQTSRADLARWFRIAPERIRVVTEGPEAAFRPLPHGPESDAALGRAGVRTDRPFVLYVGGLSPHKNLPRLIEAFGRSAPSEFGLVVVGDFGDVFHTHVPELRAAVARCGLEERVQFTGFVPDEDLTYLYNRAYVLAQPSLWEGFGLPPVEAMACGTPVACSSAGSLPEVVGDAGVFFDPTDVESITEALRKLLGDRPLRHRLALRALQRASQFTWTRAAQGLLGCFEELEPKHRRTTRRDRAITSVTPPAYRPGSSKTAQHR